MAILQFGRVGKKKGLPWCMEHPDGIRILSAFLRKPTPLCVAIGPMIREIGRQELSCYCGHCHSEPMAFDIEFPQRRPTGYRRIARVREEVCSKALAEIKRLEPNTTQQQYEEAVDRYYGRVWECNLRDGDQWYSVAPLTVRVWTWQRVADLVDIGSLMEVP